MPRHPCGTQSVLECIAKLFVEHGPPDHIQSDNGAEFTAIAVREWLERIGVKTLFIEPGSPWENGQNESFNGKLRDKLLNMEIFYTLKEAKVLIECWRRHYNTLRPHSSLGYRPQTILPRPSVPAYATLQPGQMGITRAELSHRRWTSAWRAGHQVHDDEVALFSLISKLNERFGADFTPADQLFFDQVTETALENETLREAAKVNSLGNFSLVFNKMLEGLFIERMVGNEEIFTRLMNDDQFKNVARNHLLCETYIKIRSED